LIRKFLIGAQSHEPPRSLAARMEIFTNIPQSCKTDTYKMLGFLSV